MKRGTVRKTRRGAWRVLLATCAAACTFFAPTAQATTINALEDDGLWYINETGITDIHESGITGQGVTIAIIDSPINLDVSDLAGADIRPRTEALCPGFTGVEVTERARHATAMASIIVGNGDEPGVLGAAPDATILHYAVLNVEVRECAAPLTDFVADAIDQGADILNLSISYNSRKDARRAIDLALAADLVVNVAVQNANSDRLDFLSGLPGVVSIENIDRDGNPDEFSVRGPGLDFLAPGVGIRMLKTEFSGYELDDGTSPATAWVSGVFALAKSAWPDATGNQLIQAAIRSTKTPEVAQTEPDQSSPMRTDATGYGVLDPSILIATDPSRYQDENPLLDVGPNNSSASPNTTAPGAGETNDLRFLWLGTAFLLTTGVYVVVLLVRRQRYRNAREDLRG